MAPCAALQYVCISCKFAALNTSILEKRVDLIYNAWVNNIKCIFYDKVLIMPYVGTISMCNLKFGLGLIQSHFQKNNSRSAKC